MTTASEIARLTDQEFKVALTGDHEFYGDVTDGALFEPYLDSVNIYRTFLVLSVLQAELEAKIGATDLTIPSAAAWVERTGKFLHKLKRRLTQTQITIRIQRLEARDRVAAMPPLSKAASVQPWKNFAHILCAALDGSADTATQDLLDKIPSPWPNLSAGDWYLRRLANDPTRETQGIAA